MSTQIILAFTTGVVVLLILLCIASFIAFRRNPEPVPREAMFIFRVILALGAAGLASVFSGFLEVEGKVRALTFRAAGSLAVFLMIYLYNPPEKIERRQQKPNKPRKITVPEDRIK